MPKWHSQAKLDILLASKTLLFINKPSGLIVQGAAKSQQEQSSLLPLLSQLPTPDVGLHSEEWRWHPLHRLDKLTTGCLALGAVHDHSGKMAAVPQRLLEAFASPSKVSKEYLAIVHGSGSDKSKGIREVTSMLTHSKVPDDPKVRIRSRLDKKSAAKLAKTEYMAVASDDGLSLLHLKPSTGRKHQLRVQCANVLKMPIIGDYLYGREEHSSFMYLHCWKMTFPFWERNEYGKAVMKQVTIEAPLPIEWNEFLTQMRINPKGLHLQWPTS